MHSSRCIKPARGLRTVALPSPGAQQTAQSANGVAARFGLQLTRNQAVWISLNAPALITWETRGRPGTFVYQNAGTESYLFPHHFDDVSITGDQETTVDGIAWIEEAPVFRPEEDDNCNDGEATD